MPFREARRGKIVRGQHPNSSHKESNFGSGFWGIPCIHGMPYTNVPISAMCQVPSGEANRVSNFTPSELSSLSNSQRIDFVHKLVTSSRRIQVHKLGNCCTSHKTPSGRQPFCKFGGPNLWTAPWLWLRGIRYQAAVAAKDICKCTGHGISGICFSALI